MVQLSHLGKQCPLFVNCSVIRPSVSRPVQLVSVRIAFIAIVVLPLLPLFAVVHISTPAIMIIITTVVSVSLPFVVNQVLGACPERRSLGHVHGLPG